MKRVLIILLTMVLSILQCSCSNFRASKMTETPAKDNSIKVNTGNLDPSKLEEFQGAEVTEGQYRLFKKPNKTRYLLTNGIEIQREQKAVKTSKGEVEIAEPIVAGLKDKGFEESLNKTIEQDLEVAVKSYAEEVPGEEGLYGLYPIVILNANNILSISLNPIYGDPVEGCLYRLTDGKRLYLKDIFTEGTEYVPLINPKIIEGILLKDGEEENLSRPFTSIKADQGFALTENKLYMIFKPGEAGFIQRNSVAVPLSEIDDYVDVLDRYSGTERKNHERMDLIVRKNNIFTTWKQNIIKKGDRDIWVYYPEVSGTRDSAFEKRINGDIEKAAYEAANSKLLDGLKNGTEKGKEYSALVQMSVIFNHYGILCIQRNVTAFQDIYALHALRKELSFDLINKKAIEPKELIKRYVAKDKTAKDMLCGKKLNIFYGDDNKFIDALKQKIDYDYIIKNGEVYFTNGEDKNNMTISVDFNENEDKKYAYFTIPFNSIIKGEAEDFFGW